LRTSVFALLAFAAGVLLGGYAFSNSIPRSFLAVHDCGQRCLEPRDLLGLLASAGIQHAPGLLPLKVAESAQCVGIQHWAPEGRYHVTFFPKRDVRNIMELTEQDAPFLLDCLALARKHVSAAGFENYRLVSNGPALQHLTYFHFHVIAR
jgi:Scavenger mRNA decapping enzyme C-term binding